MRTKTMLAAALSILLATACQNDEATAPSQTIATAPVLNSAGSADYPDGMVAYWKFEEGSGGTAFDVIGDRDGTLEPATDGPQWTSGIVGGALSFDGSNDFVVGHHPEQPPYFRVGTVEAWVKLYSYPTYYRYGIVAAATGIPGPDQNTCTFSEILEVDRYGMVSYYNWSNYIVRPTGPTVLELDKWYHLAATLTPAGSGRERWVRLYVNGVPGNPAWSSLGADWGNQFVFSFRNRCWGYRWDHDRFDGAIDEVAFYDRALTPEEIQQHYEDGLRGLGYETVVPVDIDVKPGSDPNCFNINGHGVIPVAILGSANFDVNEIDVGTLLFGGLEVRVRGNGPLCHVEDTDADQFPDLVCQFQDDADAWLEGDATATLTGERLDGTRFQGTDQICIVP